MPARPRSIRAIETALGLDDLIANRTMSPDIAGTLREVARQRRSFIVVAVPRLAGKSTVLRAILAERPPSSPVTTLAEDGEDVDELVKKSGGGYLIIPEITRSAAMPGYIWGADVRRIFKAAKEGVSLAATLHAEGPDDAFAQICGGCGVLDDDASKLSFAVSLRSLGRWEEPTRRVVQSVHAIDGVRGGKPRTKLLYQWDEQHDRFTQTRLIGATASSVPALVFVALAQMFILGGPYLGQVESGVVADTVSPEFSVISGGIVTVASVGLVALWAPELVSYRAPTPSATERSSRDA